MRLQLAETDTDRSRLFRYRHHLYGAAPTLKGRDGQLRDELDEIGRSYFVERNGHIEISVRLVALETLPPQLRKSHVRWLAERLEEKTCTMLSRFTCSKWGQRNLDSFFLACLELEHQAGRRWGIGDCTPLLLSYYRRLGFLAYGELFDDPDFGPKQPIILPYWDEEHLQTCGSPLAKCWSSESPTGRLLLPVRTLSRGRTSAKKEPRRK